MRARARWTTLKEHHPLLGAHQVDELYLRSFSRLIVTESNSSRYRVIMALASIWDDVLIVGTT